MDRQLCIALAAVWLVISLVGPPALRGEDAAEKPINRYAVPEGDVAALVAFLTALESYQPTKVDEQLAYRQHALKAFRAASERIVDLEADKLSDAYRKAAAILLRLRLPNVQQGDAEVQSAFYTDLMAYLKTAKAPSKQDVALAFTFGRLVEDLGNEELAKEAFAEFGKIYSASDDEDLAAYGEKMAGIARLLDLPGKEMKLEGATADGKVLDWKSYRGKVVLVDYWATWCEPCIEELPNVMENYAKYHDQGFEVVGISLDTYRGPLQRFLAAHELPWVCLFEEGAGMDHPMAKKYDVTRTPTTMLLDRDGKVVAMDVSGGDLGRQLAKLLGPASQAEESSE